MRTWCNVELKPAEAKRFKEYCRDMHLQYETSEAGNLIHFEVNVNAEEAKAADEFLFLLDSMQQVEEGKVVTKTLDELIAIE